VLKSVPRIKESFSFLSREAKKNTIQTFKINFSLFPKMCVGIQNHFHKGDLSGILIMLNITRKGQENER